MTASSSPVTIAVDGPSGSGKSSVSRAVAAALGFGYLDTGAMYRALTWWCLDQGIDTADLPAVARAAETFPLEQGSDPKAPAVTVGGADVSDEIRSTRITGAVTAVATNPDVRPVLQRRQREAMAEVAARTGGVVAEGRDITTVVAPDADVRVLITASEEARLRRRSGDVAAAGEEVDAATLRAQVLDRDAADSAVSSFLTASEGVATLDTSELSFEDMRLPASAMLPEVTGLKGPLSCLNEARFGIVFGVVGAARDCLESALSYTADREVFDKPLSGYQISQTKLADMTLEVSKGMLLALHLGRLKDGAGVSPEQISLGKLNNCREAIKIAREARTILGGNGVTLDYSPLRHANNLESVLTYEGTSEMHLLAIGKALTGQDAFR